MMQLLGRSRISLRSMRATVRAWPDGSASERALSCRRQGGLGLLDDRLEGRRLGNGEVGQDLAIDLDPGLGEAVDKSAVVEPKRPHRGIEALDPKRPEGALAALAVAVGVLVGLLDRLFGDADRVLATAEKAFRGLEDFLVLGVSGDTTFDAGHG